MEKYIVKDGKRLRYGYTTGSCATGATKAAITMLLSNKDVEEITISTPKGWNVDLEIKDISRTSDTASCAVIKDGGDDPDNTHGMYIYSKVKLIDSPQIHLAGGKGVGKITQKGLPVAVGESAINPVPREMILHAAKETAKEFNYTGGFHIEIYAPEGETVAKKTFNPKLGILGGISILGTTGIVEPMSEKALVASLQLELNILDENNHKNIILFPGNYGRKFAREDLSLNIEHSVKISNYIGEVLEHLNTKNFENVLIISHLGKLIKVAGGIMNTHSKSAVARMEILAAYASACGGDSALARKTLQCITTDEAIDLLKREPFYEDILGMILERVRYHILSRIHNDANIGLVMYTNSHGILKVDENGKQMIPLFQDK